MHRHRAELIDVAPIRNLAEIGPTPVVAHNSVASGPSLANIGRALPGSYPKLVEGYTRVMSTRADFGPHPDKMCGFPSSTGLETLV